MPLMAYGIYIKSTFNIVLLNLNRDADKQIENNVGGSFTDTWRDIPLSPAVHTWPREQFLHILYGSQQFEG